VEFAVESIRDGKPRDFAIIDAGMKRARSPKRSDICLRERAHALSRTLMHETYYKATQLLRAHLDTSTRVRLSDSHISAAVFPGLCLQPAVAD